MILRYHKGQNFGDALNPLIFDKFLPGFFDGNDEEAFVGIGSLLGFKLDYNKKYVFSTGYAAGQESTYGKVPEIDKSFEILCVRGPLTAKALKLDPSLAVTDGAALLRFFDFAPQQKAYEYSFMPHVGSEDFFDWRPLVESVGIHYISPRQEISYVMEEILKTKVMLTEAMHGAIVSDTLRVPWVPVKAYKTINDFKWQDWNASLQMNHVPKPLQAIFDKKVIQQILANKLPQLPNLLTHAFSSIYNYINHEKSIDQAKKQFDILKRVEPNLSKDSILLSKSDQLLNILMEFKSKRNL